MQHTAEVNQSAQLSLAAYTIALQYQMGSLIAEYPRRARTPEEKRTRYLLFPLLILLYLLVAGGIGMMLWTFTIPSYNSSITSSLVNALLAIGTMLFCILMFGTFFIALPLSMYRNRKPSILHCADGLIYRRGGRTIIMRWENITSISETSRAMSYKEKDRTYICTIRLDGKKYTFGREIENARELGKTIEREITQHHIAEYWQHLKHGEILRFGPLGLNQEGMYKGRDFMPWNFISQVNVARGMIVITRDGVLQKWPLARIARIPNFYLFIALVHLLTDGRISYAYFDFERQDPLLSTIIKIIRRGK